MRGQDSRRCSLLCGIGRLLLFNRCLANGNYRVFPPKTRRSANGQDAPVADVGTLRDSGRSALVPNRPLSTRSRRLELFAFTRTHSLR